AQIAPAPAATVHTHEEDVHFFGSRTGSSTDRARAWPSAGKRTTRGVDQSPTHTTPLSTTTDAGFVATGAIGCTPGVPACRRVRLPLRKFATQRSPYPSDQPSAPGKPAK